MAKIELINPQDYGKNLIFYSLKTKDEVIKQLSEPPIELDDFFSMEDVDSFYIIPARILFSHIVKVTER